MEHPPNSYCQFVKNKEASNPHRIYHDTEYGFPLASDDELLGRLILEINQAGLSWSTILKKKENFYEAYDAFKAEVIANYTEADKERLLQNAGIIRNKLKVNAAIYNAQKIIELQKEYGSFKNWLDTHHPMKKEHWVKLFKKTFKFTGVEITNEFLMSTGYLPGAHEPSCAIYQETLKHKPAWHKKPI